MCNLINTHTHTHTHTQVSLIPPWEDQREWHRMTRMTRPDCAVMCNLINTHTHTHTHTHTQAHAGEGNSFLEKLGRPLQNTRRSNRYDGCYKCGDLHTNLSRHSSGCDRIPSDTTPPHSDGLGGELSARNPDTPSTPAAENVNQSQQSSPSILLPWGIEDVGPMLDALDGTTLARVSLSTAKAIRQEHRMLFARSLRHALRIFCQARNALQVAPAGGPHDEALVTNLERATKLLHITPALLQSSDGRCSRQG